MMTYIIEHRIGSASMVFDQQSNQQKAQYFDIVMSGFVTILILSNLLSSAKIVHLELGALDLVFDAGTIVFPISYIFGDILTEIYGFARAKRVIWVGFFSMLIVSVFVGLVGNLPGETGWEDQVGQVAYDAVLGGIPGLAIASLVAYLAGEFSNSVVLAKMKLMTQGKWLIARMIMSTLAGQLLDTVLFFLIATALGVFSVEIILSLIVVNYIFKITVEICLSPLTARFIRYLKRLEGEDFYDHGTRFSIFR